MLALQAPRRVAIVAGNRIPFARSNTAYAERSNQEMLTAALQGLVERTGLHGVRLGEVVGGAVLKHSRDFNLTRESVLGTTLHPDTPAYDIQQACGTGMQAAILVANKIALGQIECGIAAGVDTTSDAPIGLNEKLRRQLLRVHRARRTAERLRQLMRVNPGLFFAPALPQIAEPRTGLSMGEHCELMAKRWGITRAEQDALACRSHQRLHAAYERGFFDGLVTPYGGLQRDNNLRAQLTVEQLSALPPAFDRKGGTLTAGNSTPLTDGASCVLLSSEAWAAERGLPVLAYLRLAETAAVDFASPSGEGLLMAPAYAVPRMLAKLGLTLQQFDYYEIHEAFAAQVLCTLKAWEDAQFCRDRLGLDRPLGKIDLERMNVNGGSLAAGHPFAATGARILAQLAKQLAERGGGRGLISICAAGGQGVVAVVER
ncbi:MAG: acetyl-CoA C-acetyltransferase [Casimicrobiaceae bacterium]|nr:acetyl-CoA C-acetyltransferase [Casimicrobiaceae bacterium]MCX8003772.1 acetyl-CoA C-acetyltransferase [Burkholderiaceae bacterium]